MEKETVQIRISVRNLVEFIMRGGDIDNRRGNISDKDAMQAGSRIHRKIQKQMGGDYRAEVVLKKCVEMDSYEISVEGRADGIFTEGDIVYIDEIKGIYKELHYLEKPVPTHKAQAMCYAYFHGEEIGAVQIGVQMTYVNIETEDIRRFSEVFSLDYLREWFYAMMKEYKKWTDYQYEARKLRQESIKKIEFPFPYREGQRNLAVSVYRTIERKKTLFLQAPTGIGKTMSAVFPAVKAVGEELGEKIFYLTAKTITRTVAEEAFEILRQKGLFFKTVTITARDKLCFLEERECNPDVCPYAKGHYDRVNDAIYDLLVNERKADRELLLAYAKKHEVCPFEMCLDVSIFSDGVICDYNYVFDPNVKLKRYFSEGIKGEYLFLVDEAHNLVERAREMYSASLYKEDFLEMKRMMLPYSKKIAADLERCNKNMLALKRECESFQVLENAGTLSLQLTRLYGDIESFLDEHRSFEYTQKLVEFFLKVRQFLNIHDMLDESFRVYTEHTPDGGFLIRLFCVHTAGVIRECLAKGSSTIFFSATLLPIGYYKELLGAQPEDYAVYTASPFDRRKRCLLIGSDVSSRYTRRNRSEYSRIYRYIRELTEAKRGNYMVFFPSYKLMQEVYETAAEEGIPERTTIFMQKNSMTEAEKEEFLLRFESTDSGVQIAFCVLGGIFSEGIDLKEERLIGTIIVGTGLPQICVEREILKDYFEEKEQNGFDYAYRFPGMNKVLQAAGRVIRTREDKGVILLLDERFMESRYQQLFPREWSDIRATTVRDAGKRVREFWGSFEK
ncbi:MAG: ATP-dependent DNA helicase [Lachnospiraceae bacterium]|nr:ATP-dependent DNA helicase [Lachnospiraceae bacterium]